jgi:cation diffusion facilitator CzcD-associated flavoprotein CzcO
MKRALILIVSGTLILLIAASTILLPQSKPKYEQPVLITSAGQSADVTIAGTIFKRANVQAKAVPLAQAADLEGVKTLVVVAGFSSKGLGAAGISREQELARVQTILQAAMDKKLKIMMLHIGGKARRGNQSDDFNKMAAEVSSYLLVVKQGDEDQFFSKIAADKKIAIDLVDKIVDAVKPVAKAFEK